MKELTIKSILKFALPLLTVMVPAPGIADRDVDFILNATHPPKGVIFEIVVGDENALDTLLPKTVSYIEQLKKKHPAMQFAVVSHGGEQFGLLKENSNNNGKAHTTVKSLLGDNVPVHVCGTHASWRNKDAKDFPDYVDVVPAGPTKITQYQRAGYALIEIQP